MSPRCAYGVCKSDSRYKHTEHMKGVCFIRIPLPSLNLEMCKRWVYACGRKNFTHKNVTQYSYICSKHFVGGQGPTKAHPHPIPYNQSTTSVSTRIPPKVRQILPIRKIYPAEFEQETCAEPATECESKHAGVQVKAEMNDCGMQTLSNNYAGQLFTCIENSHTITPGRHADFAFYESAKLNPTMFHYFTGVTLQHFNIIYHQFLKEENMNALKYKAENDTPEKIFPNHCKLTNADKLYITLMRLRRGFTLQEIAYFVACPLSTISVIVYTWIQFLYHEFLSLRRIMFQNRLSQKSNKPGCFKRFKNLRVIIDCIEIFIQMPQNFEEQGNTFSSYKHCNTVKFLVGISVNMAIIFMSDGFDGSISDREIFIKSGIMNYLEPGDEVMCDRGYNIQDLTDPIKVTIIQPPFLGSRASLTPQEEVLTKVIARCRVHVERAINRIKNFKLLQPYIPYTLLPTISNIFYVAGCLANFADVELS